MTYASLTQVRTVLSRSDGSTADTAASLPDDRITAALQEADDEINAKLAGVYAVPFTGTVPDMIVRIATSIAAYLADLTFREVRDYQSDLNPVFLRYRHAQETLTALASGSLDLDAPPATDQTLDEGVMVTSYSDGDVFTDCDTPIPPRLSSRSWWGVW